MDKSEAQTRLELIDQQLAMSGWNVKDPLQVVEEFDIDGADAELTHWPIPHCPNTNRQKSSTGNGSQGRSRGQ